MLKIILVQPGRPDREIEVDGDVATVGRCVELRRRGDEPFVSAAPGSILRGTVVVDLDSSNGTFVGGRRVAGTSGVTVLGGESISLCAE
ncbi:MAG: hypothetical protein R3F34_12240 [Planctomycetota bacterium]